MPVRNTPWSESEKILLFAAAAGQTLSRPRRFMKTARSMPGMRFCASAFVNM